PEVDCEEAVVDVAPAPVEPEPVEWVAPPCRARVLELRLPLAANRVAAELRPVAADPVDRRARPLAASRVDAAPGDAAREADALCVARSIATLPPTATTRPTAPAARPALPAPLPSSLSAPKSHLRLKTDAIARPDFLTESVSAWARWRRA